MAGVGMRVLSHRQGRCVVGLRTRGLERSSRRAVCHCESSSSSSDEKPRKRRDIKSTIDNIDTLLGIDDDATKEQVEENGASPAEEAVNVGISAEAVGKLLQLQETSSMAVLEKAAKDKTGGRGMSSTPLDSNGAAPEKDNKGSESAGEQQPRDFRKNPFTSLQDFMDYLPEEDRKALEKTMEEEKRRMGGGPEDDVFELFKERRVSEEVVQDIKDRILGYSTFLVREVERPLLWEGRDTAGAVLLRGNARKDAQVVSQTLQAGLDDTYGQGQFTVYVLPDTEAEERQEDGRQRFILQVLPRGMGPPKTAGWQVFAAIVLLALTIASTASLAALVSVPKLPPETLAYLASGDRPVDGEAIPGIGPSFDPLPFARVFAETFLGVAGVNIAHEVGHRVVAAFAGVKLGPSLNVPNGSLGSFGAVTPAASPFRNRRELFDIAFAGPLFGTVVAGSLFIYGLLLSTDPTTDPAIMLPLPTSVFQGSIVLGSICEATLGPATAGKQSVHPALIAGWAGLFVQALNLLPVGALDGGRMVRATYGPMAHRLTSILTYFGLTLGFIGGTLSLPFGLFVLIAQRDSEAYIIDQVTPTDNARELTAAAMVLFALAVLIPFTPEAPELVDSIQIGLQNDALQGTLQSTASTFQI